MDSPKEFATLFEDELKDLLADEKRGFLPPPKWMAELLWMVKQGEISQSAAKTVQETWTERRRQAYHRLYELATTI